MFDDREEPFFQLASGEYVYVATWAMVASLQATGHRLTVDPAGELQVDNLHKIHEDVAAMTEADHQDVIAILDDERGRSVQ